MKIAIFTHNYPASSSDRQNAGIFVYDLAHALKKMGHEIIVLCPDSVQKKERSDVKVKWFNWPGKGRKLGSLNYLNPYDLWIFISMIIFGCLAAENFCKEEKVDFVIGMWAFPAGVFALWTKLRNKVPYCLWALGSDIYIYARYPLLKNLIKIALSKAGFLVADGLDLARQVNKISGHKCTFIPSASNISKFIKHKVKDGPIKFVFLGRMEFVKGPDILIDAFLKIKNLNFELHLMGDGVLLSQLKERVQQFGLGKKIFFYGNVSDPKVILSTLSSSDWLVIPSRSDSIPLVFSEGMKASTPVIVADVGDMVELVKTYKVGHFFPKENLDALVNLLKKVLMEKRTNLSDFKPQLKKVAELFDINLSSEKLISMIKNNLKC